MIKYPREMSLYETFDGREISEFYDLVTVELTSMKKELETQLSSNVQKALEDRIESFKCLREDLCTVWSEMIKDGHWNGIRNKRKFMNGE